MQNYDGYVRQILKREIDTANGEIYLDSLINKIKNLNDYIIFQVQDIFSKRNGLYNKIDIEVLGIDPDKFPEKILIKIAILEPFFYETYITLNMDSKIPSVSVASDSEMDKIVAEYINNSDIVSDITKLSNYFELLKQITLLKIPILGTGMFFKVIYDRGMLKGKLYVTWTDYEIDLATIHFDIEKITSEYYEGELLKRMLGSTKILKILEIDTTPIEDIISNLYKIDSLFQFSDIEDENKYYFLGNEGVLTEINAVSVASSKHTLIFTFKDGSTLEIPKNMVIVVNGNSKTKTEASNLIKRNTRKL